MMYLAQTYDHDCRKSHLCELKFSSDSRKFVVLLATASKNVLNTPWKVFCKDL